MKDLVSFRKPLSQFPTFDKFLLNEFDFEDEFIKPFNRIVQDFFGEFGKDDVKDLTIFDKATYPKADIIHYDNEIKIIIDVPGINKDDIKIILVEKDEDDPVLCKYPQLVKLQVSSAKREIIDQKNPQLVHKELRRSAFTRSFYLNKDDLIVDDGIISHENGSLIFTYPKHKKIENLEEPKKEKKVIKEIKL